MKKKKKYWLPLVRFKASDWEHHDEHMAIRDAKGKNLPVGDIAGFLVEINKKVVKITNIAFRQDEQIGNMLVIPYSCIEGEIEYLDQGEPDDRLRSRSRVDPRNPKRRKGMEKPEGDIRLVPADRTGPSLGTFCMVREPKG